MSYSSQDNDWFVFHGSRFSIRDFLFKRRDPRIFFEVLGSTQFFYSVGNRCKTKDTFCED